MWATRRRLALFFRLNRTLTLFDSSFKHARPITSKGASPLRPNAKLPFLREPTVFHAWTLRIASRIAITHLKRTHRWQPLDDSLLRTFTSDPNLGGPPDAAFLSLLDQVSPASRAVLLLHYQHDLSLEETAAVLDIPVGTAKSRLHYGVATLRKHLTFERKPA